MIGAVARKLFGSANDRRIRAFRPRVDEINALEKELEELSDEALRARTDEFKKQIAEGASLDDILVPAFATVREAGKRTADWMGQIYPFLGLTVGVIVHGLDDEQRKKAYDCDVTFGTNNELGFDYLRDNMKYRLEDMG